ncbi:hypothetical protein [Tahibacter amnicola]|uniref:HEAT repeat protein n=1 Tax=Tahibacter amnicola TaxID=2976241 RepID=A0ABY6BP53_9GAMM|nr:hypothetical protein [Tahibacter amnicola]UXI70180.1 hypothetical protein N4264_11275 [Tahibacter amnicola]
MVRLPVVLLLLVPVFAQAADTAKLLKRTERGETRDRINALNDLGDADAPAAVTRATEWLESQTDARLRAAAARLLWDHKDAAAPAEPALRRALDDADEETAYAAVGALDAMGVPDAQLRSTRLRLARQARDAYYAFYAARALYPDPDLPLANVLDVVFDAVDLSKNEDALDFSARHDLGDATYTLLARVAKENGREGFSALVDAFARESPAVRYTISRVIGSVPVESGDPKRIAALMTGARADVRGFLLAALGGYGARAQPALDVMLGELALNNEPAVRKDAASALSRVADVPGALSDMQKAGSWRTQVETRIAPALARLVVDDPEPAVRTAAAESLERLQLWGAPAASVVAPVIARQDDAAARLALVSVCKWARGTPGFPREVLEKLAASDPDTYVRRDAGDALRAASQ